MNVTEYVRKEYDHAGILYKNLSKIKTLGPNEKKEGLKLLDKQLEIIDGLEEECGTPLEERQLSFIVRTIAAARRLCLE